jgi:hypothetical protein
MSPTTTNHIFDLRRLLNLIPNFVWAPDRPQLVYITTTHQMSASIQEPKSLGSFASGSGLKQEYPRVFVTRDVPNEDGLTVTAQDMGVRCITVSCCNYLYTN